jgi:hypothetical protein
MHLRLHTKIVTGILADMAYLYCPVTAVTDTTITISGYLNSFIVKQGEINNSAGFLNTLWKKTVINGCYLPDRFSGERAYIQVGLSESSGTYFPTPIFGASLKISRTRADGEVYYRLYDAPIPHNPAWEYLFNDYLQDASSSFTTSGGSDTFVQYRGLSSISANLSIDTNLGKELPRACKYLSLWQNQLVQAGRAADMNFIIGQNYPNFLKSAGASVISGVDFSKYQDSDICEASSVYWADVENVEGFPQSGSNEEDFRYVYKDTVTGISANKEALFVFKNKTTGYLSGSPATGDFVKEYLEADVGCATQGSVQEVRGSVVFMDENLGFWSVVAGRLPEFIGNPLIDYFKNNEKIPKNRKLNFKLARSANFRDQDLYVCWIQGGTRSSNVDPLPYSVIFVFDYSAIGKSKRNCWYQWSGVNAGGGILAASNGKLLIAGYGTNKNIIQQMKFTGSKYDFSDHTSAIEFNYKGAFLTLNEPTIDKSWIRCVINSIQGGFNLVVQQYANFIDTITSDYTMAMPSPPKQTVKMDVKASIPKLSGISWGFYNNEVNADVKIDGWEVEYNTPFDKGEPKK